MSAASSATTYQRYPGENQGDAREHGHADTLAEDHDTEHDRDYWQQVGHRRCDGGSLAGSKQETGTTLVARGIWG
jgi:hypothetical protein